MNSGNTRQKKVSKFLDTIKCKGNMGMKHFFDALAFEHPELYKTFTGREASAGIKVFYCQLTLMSEIFATRNFCGIYSRDGTLSV